VVVQASESDRRLRRRSAVRERILDAAWWPARRDGVAAMSLRNLAREVDLTRPALYSDFASKNALYDRSAAA
jgi:AcrR family transcriptional regulator